MYYFLKTAGVIHNTTVYFCYVYFELYSNVVDCLKSSIEKEV